MRPFICLLALFLLAACASAASGDPPWLFHFGHLAPHDRVFAHQLLAEWRALHEAAAVTAGGSAVQALAQQKHQQLQALLPQLPQTTDSAPSQVLARASEALAAQLQPSATQNRLAGILTLVNIAWFCGCVLLVVAAVSLVGAYLAALVMLVPLPVWEAVGYAGSLWVLHAATRSAPGTAPYIGLTGLLMLTACIGGSLFLHLADRIKDNEAAKAILMGFFALLYGLVAVRLQASLLGTLAVWWAVSALGFSIFVFPFLTVIGFRNGMMAPFSASLALVLAFLPFKAAPSMLHTPAALRPFETGVWLWCTLVLNVANLIMAHQHWERSRHSTAVPTEAWSQLPLHVRLRHLIRLSGRCVASQVPSVAVIGSTLACGVLLDVEQCRALGSVFGFLWLMSRLAECNWKRVGLAWAALAFGSVLWGSAYAVHAWPHAFVGARVPAS